ncbi:N-alpha-acetyltransferase 30-like isoform X2 [Dreissena polymorpha]|uniref:N-terminal methionine N(alpha)-acetyltransferase NatC n=1 Tax=Dreissena polymorpha TaxID=45954 RepID=A0A9D4QX85_DREPO|nr:N-alpha-acetyltransferase 30-like isoform X2 [Dreissena polymorpha]KAH3846077.1 hypothetical protein DPMN_088371 [Dreissena polymorpha]
MAECLTTECAGEKLGVSTENVYPTHIDKSKEKAHLAVNGINGMTKHSFDINVNGYANNTECVMNAIPCNQCENLDATNDSDCRGDATHAESSLKEDVSCLNCEQTESNTQDLNDAASKISCLTISDGVDTNSSDRDIVCGIEYIVYKSELQMKDIMRLITKDLSEPYSIYTYRYFIHNWPKLCFLAMDGQKCVGAIVCKLDMHKKMVHRGYIAMLAVDAEYRRKKIGSHLVLKAIKAMIADDCDEVVLETEITNKSALRLYENLGFVRDKRLFRYYLNGEDALRLKLWLR